MITSVLTDVLPFPDSQPVVWLGRHHVRPLSGAVLDVLWSDTDRQGCDQNAHTKDLCNNRIQRVADREGDRPANGHSAHRQAAPGAVQSIPPEPKGKAAPESKDGSGRRSCGEGQPVGARLWGVCDRDGGLLCGVDCELVGAKLSQAPSQKPANDDEDPPQAVASRLVLLTLPTTPKNSQ